jgi:predicted DNA-binding transcriptional regulator YafY
MNRIDRLFAIILLLQHRRRIKAFEIAQRFEVGLRTVYRDVSALLESGVPIISVPGVGYELMDGYTLPPLVFTPDEAAGLFLGAKMLLSHTSGSTATHTERALERLVVAMPNQVRERAENLTRAIDFHAPRKRFDLNHPHLQAISDAIRDRRVIRLEYHALNHIQTKLRDLEPARLTYDQNAWYVDGFCRLRQAQRAFRLERIERLEVLPEVFSLHKTVSEQMQLLTAKVRFAAHIQRWVLENQHYGFESLEQDGTGVVMTYRVKAIAELRPWLLGWGADAEALEPPALRNAIRLEAQRILEQLT